MFAVIKTGGKQYCVGTGDVISVEKLADAADSEYVFEDVLMLGEGDAVTLAASKLKDALVKGKIVAHDRADKITIYKSRQRNTYRRKLGHRQNLSMVEITTIAANGRHSAQATKAAPAKPAASDEAASLKAPATKPEAASTAKQAQPAESKAAKAPPASTAKQAEPDDLSQLKGVGPALLTKLNNVGLTRLEHVANLDEARIAEIEQELKISGRFAANDWVAQAKTLI